MGDVDVGQISFERSDQQRGRTLAIAGEVDLAVVAEMDSELAALLAEADASAFVDLSGVSFMDAIGIHALLRATDAGGAVGKSVVLVAPSRPCRRVFDASGTSDLFDVTD